MSIQVKKIYTCKIIYSLVVITLLAIPCHQAAAASVPLRWTAPGDDGNSGSATAYDIRFSLTPLDESSWGTAYRVVNPPIPQAAGSIQSTIVTSLLPNTTYYFGIKTRDEVNNWSALSNIIAITTNADSLITGSSSVVLISPSNNAIIGNPSPFLTVQNDIQGTIFYYFEISPDPSFSSQVINSPPVDGNGLSTVLWEVPNQLSTDQTYYWRVHSGDFIYSESWNFTIESTTYPYPNPFRPDEISSVTFTGIPEDANLWIMTVSGTPVNNWQNITGGEINWNGFNQSGQAVSSGLYIWYIEGTNIKGKLILVR